VVFDKAIFTLGVVTYVLWSWCSRARLRSRCSEHSWVENCNSIQEFHVSNKLGFGDTKTSFTGHLIFNVSYKFRFKIKLKIMLNKFSKIKSIMLPRVLEDAWF
jgi:hypothetical protein